MRRLFAAIALIAGLAAPARAQPLPAGEAAVMDAAVRDMCRSQVAVLGEADHWVLRTIGLKVALVRRLITECGFGAVLFEAGQYDFLDLERRRAHGEPVTSAMVSAAVGGIWNRYEPIQPLLGHLAALTNEGRIRLGGIDDQIGGAGMLYETDAMPDELTGLLPAPRAARCRDYFRRLIYNGSLRSDAERSDLRSCIAEIRTAVAAGPPDQRLTRLQMIGSIARATMRHGLDAPANFRGRDLSMWQTFRWHARRWPRGTRIILWTHSIHGGRDVTMTSDAQGGNLGAYIHAAYRRRAFVLGFSARDGSHGFSSRPIVPTELEVRALAEVNHPDSLYLDHAALRRRGSIEAGFINFRPLTADWSRTFDGAILLREERAPTPHRAPS